jgi:hypothetical protein
MSEALEARLCKICNRLLIPDDSFKFISYAPFGAEVFIEKQDDGNGGVKEIAHVLQSVRLTKKMLKKREAKIQIKETRK